MAKYEHIELSKDMYSTSKSLTEYLETISDTNDIETQGLDAYEKQLKRFDIKVSGRDCDIVSKFFENEQFAILFPEFVRRIIETAYEEKTKIFDSYVLANTVYYDKNTRIKSAQIDSPIVSSNKSIKRISSDCMMRIILRDLNCTYETIKKLKISTFVQMIKSIGFDLGMDSIGLFGLKVRENAAKIPMVSRESVHESDLTYSNIMDIVADYSTVNSVLCSSFTMNHLFLPNNFAGCENIDKGIIKTPQGIIFVACEAINTNEMYLFNSESTFEKHICSNLDVTALSLEDDLEDTITTIIDKKFETLGGKIFVDYSILNADTIFMLNITD